MGKFLNTYIIGILTGIAALVCSTSVFAAQITLQETNVSNSTQNLAVPISIQCNAGEGVAAMNMIIMYDPEQIDWSHMTTTQNLLQGEKLIYANEISAGVLNVVVYGLNQTLVQNGTFAYVNFTTVNDIFDTQIDVRINNVVASCENGRTVDVSIENEMISIGSNFPTVSITSPENSSILSRTSTSVRGTVSDDSISEVILEHIADGVSTEITIAVIDKTFEEQMTIAEGSNQIIARCYNVDGALASDDVVFTVDTSILGSPTILNNDSQHNSSSITIEWTDESESGAVSYEIIREGELEADLGTFSQAGNATLVESVQKYGISSLHLDGNGDYVAIPDSADWDFETNSFTIDGWIRLDSLNTVSVICSQERNSIDYAILYFDPSKGLSFALNTSVANQYLVMNEGTVAQWATGVWTHIALVRNGSSYTLYRNGTAVASAVDVAPWPNMSGNVYVGCQSWNGNKMSFINGYVDEFRISNGIARWTTDFTPAAFAENVDQYTNLFLHFEDEGVIPTVVSTSNDTQIVDATLEERTYTYKVRSISSAGSTSAFSNGYTVTVDTTAPEAPTINETMQYVPLAPFTLSGTKSTDSEQIVITAANCMVHTISYPTDTTWTASVELSQDGTYALSVYAMDAAGNQSTPIQMNLIVDSTPPVVTSIADNVDSARIGAGSNVDVTVHGEAGCSAYFWLHSVSSYVEMTEMTSGIYQGSYTIQPDNTNGLTYVKAKLIDGATNETTISAATTFTIDTVPPTITDVAEDSAGAALKEGDVLTVTIHGASGQLGYFSIAEIVDQVVCNEIQAGVYEGSYTVQAGDNAVQSVVSGRLVDDIGNANIVQAQGRVTVDTTPPVITIQSHTDGQAITARSITLQGIIDDIAISTIEINSVEHQVVGGAFNAVVEFDDNGINVVDCYAADVAGNVGHLEMSFDVVLPPVTPTFISPVNPNVPGNFTIEWSDESTSGAESYEVVREGESEPDYGTYTTSGSASVSIADYYFGTGALSFPGVNSYISFPDSDDWYFANEDFAIDFWVKFSTLSDVTVLFAQERTKEDFGILYFHPQDGISLCVNTRGYDQYIMISEGTAANWQANTWTHVALVRSNGTYTIYKDGSAVTSVSDSSPWPNLKGSLYVGCQYWRGKYQNFFTGKIDEFRVSKGTPRWTADFTPPVKRHMTDADTKLMLHFDGDNAVASETYNTSELSIEQSDLQDGSYTYTIRAFSRDNLVASPYSDAFTVTVDTIPPAMPTINPVAVLRNSRTVQLSGTKSADTEEIIISADNMSVDSLTYPGSGVWEAMVSFAQDGAFELMVTAADAAGNTSNIVTQQINIDTVAPVVAITSPENGFSTAQKNVTVNGTIDDASINQVVITITNAQGTTSQTAVVASNAFSFTYGMARGVNAFTIVAIDDAGNQGRADVQTSFTNSLPLIIIPVDNIAVGYGDPVQFSIRIVDQNQIHPDLLSFSVQNLPGEGTINPASFNALTGEFSWTPDEDQVGLYADIIFTVQDDNKATTEIVKIIVQSYDFETEKFNKVIGNSKSSQVIIEDFNNDGYDDMYMANIGNNTYLVSNGDGTFSNMTDSAQCDDSGEGVSAACGDINNDGYADIYLINNGENRLFINNGDGTFTEQGFGAGVNDANTGVAAYICDLNNDGDADIYLLNDSNNVLFINDGGGNFTDQTVLAGLNNAGVAENACVKDIDQDGDLDIYVVNSGDNKMYLNDGSGIFIDDSSGSHTDDASTGCTAKIYDFDFDHDNDIVITNHYYDVIYLNNGKMNFRKLLLTKEYDPTLDTKISLFFDYDVDGDIDILLVDKNSRYVNGLGNILYCNNGDNTFSDVTVQSNVM